jgi:hypothetical protein
MAQGDARQTPLFGMAVAIHSRSLLLFRSGPATGILHDDSESASTHATWNARVNDRCRTTGKTCPNDPKRPGHPSEE